MTLPADLDTDEAYAPLPVHIEDFLTDLTNANKPPNTIRAYRGDLAAFAEHYDGDLAMMGVEPVRAFMTAISVLSPATRKRKRAAVSAFCRWALVQDRLPVNPMDRVDTITVPKRLPRPVPESNIMRVLNAICPRHPRKAVPLDRLRDRVLFETAYICGARASEVCGLYVEDFDLTLDNERVTLRGKGGTVRSVLLDDRGYLALLRLYLKRAKYTHGPIFRASINGRGGPLTYNAAYRRWESYCETAGVDIEIHQLRHSHATELINAGVSIETVRKRLGHASTETTQIYTLLADQVADAELRAANRRRSTRR
ncbi:tyrosine-type recombinase/integrase [Nocardia sp. NPDC048505]|uniref:tyrosine-type recombinase/integrase n=1 Tax=Nocardia sp. NPDC048505 TaxID=3155756 RepID=UPI0033FE8DA2